MHHFGETSFGKLVPTARYNEILEENKRRFEEKWGEPWQPYERRREPEYESCGSGSARSSPTRSRRGDRADGEQG